ncbi:MAG: hypothetical protein CMO55_06475 [Verrucomicrobiales bacterium]|nr:hypothetical protein [Verrucomicrobiales bacterium]
MRNGFLLAIGIVALMAGGLWFAAWDFCRIKDWGVNETSVEIDWIPPEATEVTFVSGNIEKRAEFSIDQQIFEEWCASIGKPLTVVSKGSESGGFSEAMLFRSNPLLALKGITEKPNDDDAAFAWEYKSFDKGDLFFEERWPNAGGYAIGYDVSEGRGYYEYAHH